MLGKNLDKQKFSFESLRMIAKTEFIRYYSSIIKRVPLKVKHLEEKKRNGAVKKVAIFSKATTKTCFHRLVF